MPYQPNDLQTACPHCGNPFRVPARTFTLIAQGGIMRCNVCTATFFMGLKPTGSTYYRDAATFAPLQAWTGPPLHPEKVAAKDGSLGVAT
jgi:hypothetical protein